MWIVWNHPFLDLPGFPRKCYLILCTPHLITPTNFKNSNTRVDFIKIDVECSELKVLTGLRKTLKNNDNLKILIEYSYPCRETFNIEPNDNMKLLSEYGFHFSDATYKDATVFFDYDYLVSKYTNSWINFFCVKK